MAHDLGMTELERRASTNAQAEVNARSLAVTLRQEGDVWRIERGGLVVRIRDSRGIRLLSKLVERPDEEIHVLALASDDGTNISESSAGDLIDDQARHAYRRRLGDLETEIAAAESRADAGRSAQLEREMEALKRELARATGLGGRIRQGKSVTERARVNVQKRMKEAITRITEADQGLGLFFEHAVCTGTFCCFRP